MMKNSKKLKKLKLLKAIASSQRESKKLEQQVSINTIQTKLLELELGQLKNHLQGLESSRDELAAIVKSIKDEEEEEQ